MASASSSPPPAIDRFDLGIHTPANLARGARAALLRNTPAVVCRPIGTPSPLGRVAETPSSPFHALPRAAATEGAQRASPISILKTPSNEIHQPISIAESANRIMREHAEASNAKLRVFHAFCEAFNTTARQFTANADIEIAQQLSQEFLSLWSRSLLTTDSAQKPTYANVLTQDLPSPLALNQHKQQLIPRRQGQPSPPAPQQAIRPPEDLRVFVRLNPDAPARKHIGFAIRTHVATKTGIELHQIPQISRIDTGWSIHAKDPTTRDLLMQRKTDWAEDLGATAVEIPERWYTYIVEDCPRRLSDILGNEIDFDSAVKDEITCQTGLAPVSVRPTRKDSTEQPTRTILVTFIKPIYKRWTLFGTSRPARFIPTNNPPHQCDTCWSYHKRRDCSRQARCKLCGKPDHQPNDCIVPVKCTNCLGPHAADFPRCPARPKRVHGMLRALTKDERSRVREIGSQLYQQKILEESVDDARTSNARQTPLSEPSEHRLLSPYGEMQEPEIQEQSASRASSCTTEVAPSCIVVATTPEHTIMMDHSATGTEPASPTKKRRYNHNTKSNA